MSVEVRRYTQGQKRIESTIERLLQAKLPVNESVLKKIRSNLDNGRYTSDRAALVHDVQLDPGLYLRTTRALAGAAKDLPSHTADTVSSSRLESALRSAAPDELRRIFDESAEELPLTARKLSAAQALRMQHAIISSQAAAAMAERAGLDAETAFTGATVRQLGLHAMAWQCPREYLKALRTQRSGKGKLEEELESALGISPQELSRRLAEEWGIDELAEEAFDESGSEPQGNHPHTLTLREVYELAELFAKANDAENYRDAPGAWATAADSHPAVCADLGTALATRVTEALEALTTAGGRAMTPGLIPTVAWAGSTTTGMKLFLANRAVRKCAPDIQASARAVYERIEHDSQPNVLALKELVDKTVGTLGFLRGCLYLVNEIQKRIVPALRIGDLPREAYQAFPIHLNNIITTSIDSKIPILQRGTAMDGSLRLRICGGLDATKQTGVLYLELDERFFELSPYDPILHFHLLKCAFTDCLGIR